jgi:hypothetical protein
MSRGVRREVIVVADVDVDDVEERARDTQKNPVHIAT